MTETQPFRGLADVVEVWRDVREDIEDHGQFPPALGDVLRMADEYMTEVESQAAVNESGRMPTTQTVEVTDERKLPFQSDLSPVGLLPERPCGAAERHHGHEWRLSLGGNAEMVWCNGVTPTA